MAFGDSCKVVTPESPFSPAEKAYRDNNNGKAALELARAELAAKPGDPRTIFFFARAAYRQGQDEEARAVVERNSSATSVWLLVAHSDLLLRQGKFDQAMQTAVAAVKADVCNAQAHLQVGILFAYSAMYAQRKKQVTIARALDTSDPEIYRSWFRVQDDTVRLQEYRRLAKDPNEDEKMHAFFASKADAIEEHNAGKAHTCHVTSTATSLITAMVPLMEDGQTIRAWGLSVKVNDHATTMLLDSGAGGLILNHAAAERSGLKPVAKGKYGGIGDDGQKGMSIAYAEKIRIGDLEFADCDVLIDDRRSIAGTQGLIGTDVFKDKLITLDFPLRQFKLSPLPGPAPEKAALDTTSTPTGENTNWNDAYDGPELNGYLPIYLMRGDILLNMTLNSKPELMVMDTGADGTLFDKTKATEFTTITHDSSYTGSVEGVSGKVKNVYVTGEVMMKFGNISQFQNGALATASLEDWPVHVAGLLGSSYLYNLVVDIDYRDARVRFTYDRNHGHNATFHN